MAKQYLRDAVNPDGLMAITRKETTMNLEEIIGYDALWESAMKCQRNVRWKPSTKQFIINAPEEIERMHGKIANGLWKNGRPKPIQITYPKRREGPSIPFRDRVYQRSINDNLLYPEMTRHFIYANCACQRGQGTKLARKLLKKYLWNHYCHYGTDGYILQIDIKGYYPNMRHDVVESCFGRYIHGRVFNMICDVLDSQYGGDVGYNPGSQMVQIAGISVLNDIDHYIKERLHIRHYLRYMDDFALIHRDRKYLEDCLEQIKIRLAQIGFTVNNKKTKIIPLRNGWRFLGFDYRLTDTGKVLMFVPGERVRHERKKLRRMVAKCKRDEIERSKIDQCYASWKAHAAQGNSYKLIQRMDEYYRQLWSDDNEGYKKRSDADATSTA